MTTGFLEIYNSCRPHGTAAAGSHCQPWAAAGLEVAVIKADTLDLSCLSARQIDQLKSKLLATREVVSSGCWEWTGCRHPQGYGHIHIRGIRSVGCRVHRLAYSLWVGNIPEGMLVLHNCDNRPCFRPDHLRLGTQAENARDTADRGRSTRGELDGFHKLTEADVLDIRERLRDHSVRQVDLAMEHGITQTCVSAINTGKTWKWLTKGVSDAVSSSARLAQSTD